MPAAANRHASMMYDPLPDVAARPPARCRRRLSSIRTSIAPSCSSASTARRARWASCSTGPSGVTVAEAVEPLAELVGGDEPVTSAGRSSRKRSSSSASSRSRSVRRRSCSARSASCRARSRRARTSGRSARSRVFAGYAGWGPGQLEGELAESSWIVEPALPDDVFADDPDALWSDVLRRKGGPYAVLSLMPPDPRSN